MRHADEALKLSDRLAGKMKGTGNRKGKKKGKASAGCITCELFDMSTTLVTKLANSFSDSTCGDIRAVKTRLWQPGTRCRELLSGPNTRRRPPSQANP